MDDVILKSIEELRVFREAHIEVGALFLSAHQSDFYPFDFLAVATFNRSMSLLRGFCDLLVSENFIAAVPLLRLQLDNYLRFSAGWMVEDPHDFTLSIMKGVRVNQLNDCDGKRMTDRYLVETMSKKDSRIKTLYDHTSGYIHLSDRHMFNSIRVSSNNAEREHPIPVEMKITDRDAYISDELYLEAIQAFGEITKMLLHLGYSWAVTKENPANS